MSSWFITIPPHGAARTVGSEVVAAFGRLGIRHKSFDTHAVDSWFAKLVREPTDEIVVDLLNHALIVQALDFEATHVLVLALCPVTLFTLQLLRKQRVRTVHWFYEDYRKATYWKEVLKGYDLFAAIQRGPIPAACEAAGSTYAFLHTAAASACLNAPCVARSRDAAFVGIPSQHRTEILEYLSGNGITLAIAGHGWKSYRGPLERWIVSGEWVAPEQEAAVLASARVGIDIPSSVAPDGLSETNVSPRVYEILACGADLLAEDVPLLGEALKGCQYETFATKEEALEILKNLCDTFDTSSKRRNDNRRVVAQQHSYESRVRELCEFAGAGAQSQSS